MTQAMAPPNADSKLPEDVADAWATVLIDIHEKRKRPRPGADDRELDSRAYETSEGHKDA